MKTSQELYDKLEVLRAELRLHDDWARRTNGTLNSEAHEKYEQDKKEWREAESRRGEGLLGLMKLLREFTAKFDYLTTVLNHVYDFQRKPRKKARKRA